jgi:hypothetical protein
MRRLLRRQGTAGSKSDVVADQVKRAFARFASSIHHHSSLLSAHVDPHCLLFNVHWVIHGGVKKKKKKKKKKNLSCASVLSLRVACAHLARHHLLYYVHCRESIHSSILCIHTHTAGCACQAVVGWNCALPPARTSPPGSQDDATWNETIVFKRIFHDRSSVCASSDRLCSARQFSARLECRH